MTREHEAQTLRAGRKAAQYRSYPPPKPNKFPERKRQPNARAWDTEECLALDWFYVADREGYTPFPQVREYITKHKPYEYIEPVEGAAFLRSCSFPCLGELVGEPTDQRLYQSFRDWLKVRLGRRPTRTEEDKVLQHYAAYSHWLQPDTVEPKLESTRNEGLEGWSSIEFGELETPVSDSVELLTVA